ncbi:MAG: hypothetical protein KIT16_23940, partial [Rhodospirillaceae bacterium]|nr:hypothetical protein [Rhodospirillaceae bacterium]
MRAVHPSVLVAFLLGAAAIGARFVLNDYLKPSVSERQSESGPCSTENLDAPTAIGECTKLIENDGTTPNQKAVAYYIRAVLYARGKRREQALADYSRSLALVPD